MFHLDLPNVIKVLTKGEIKLDAAASESGRNECRDDDTKENVRDKPIVIVSVFGPSVHQIVRGAKYQRAFQLALDAFGTTSLYDETVENDHTHASFSKEDEHVAQEENHVGGGGESEESETANENSTKGEDFNSRERGSDHLTSAKEKNIQTGTLEGFLNDDESVLFLHIDGFSDHSSLCMEACKEISTTLATTSMNDSNFLSIWSTVNNNYCKWLLLLFSMSHIMIMSENGSSFDTSYISLFRALDIVRQDLRSAVSKILGTLEGLPKQWIDHARLCSPRLLFLFELETDESSKVQITPSFSTSRIKEWQNSLQNDIYQIFRKCRIITNISANSLFAVPATDDFVFVYDKSAQNSTSVSESLSYTYMDLILSTCKRQVQRSNMFAARSSSNTVLPVKMSFRSDQTTNTYTDIVDAFRTFLSEHISIALTKGFDDDYRRVSGSKHFFVLPTLGQWEEAYKKLHKELILDPSSRRILEGYHRLKKSINVDSEYLEIQCSELFPKVYSAYQRGLPEFYTAQQHQSKVAYAVNVFLNISRGPGVIPWLEKLALKCEKYWKNGRQQCETLSLLGHVCVNPIHRIRRQDHLEIVPLPEMNADLPEIPHSSSTRITSYCNCGKRQGTREEPFTIREANYEFYRKLAKDCCDKLESYEFTVFIPPKESSDKLSLQDMLLILQKKSESLTAATYGGDKSPSNNYGLATQESQEEVFESELRQEDGLDDESDESEEEDDLPEVSTTRAELNEMFETHESLVKTTEEGKLLPKFMKNNGLISSGRDYLERKSSTVEYLPGMYHSKSPQGLLTLFPSWSLVCLGPSSVYSHSHGVHQPGFVGGSNGLLPWDVKVKAEKGVTFAPSHPRMFRGRRHSSKQKLLLSLNSELCIPSDEFSVKVFFGFEYECRKGHRFFCDSDRVLNAINYSAVTQKTVAGKVIASDMPLYTYCPCKESRDARQIAQLMRMHVVTPKAPVFVTVNPKVLPGPPGTCPIFSTGEEGIKLSPSTYWILRLPFSYVGEVVYVPPSDVTRYNGRLLKGSLKVVSMSPEETEAWEMQNHSRV